MKKAFSAAAKSSSMGLPLALGLAFSLSIVLALVMLLITGLVAFGIGWQKLNVVATAAQTSPTELLSQGITGYFTPIQLRPDSQGKVNFLILGVDTLTNRDNAIPLTDTIMFVSINTLTGQIKTVSLPRDIWDDQYHDKINALYAIGLQRQVFPPTQLATQELQTLTGVPIDHVVIVTLDQVAELIDLMGGVTINVPNAFTDEWFPRPDVDVTKVHDPALLYEKVTFDAGPQVMNGARALVYIRSRHSTGIEGTDNARGLRQQLVLQSVIQQLKTVQPTSNLPFVGQLYGYYVRNFSSQLSVPQAIALGKKLYPHLGQLDFTGQTVSVFPDDKNGVIFHPDVRLTRGEWEYQIKDLKAFATEVQTKLGLQ